MKMPDPGNPRSCRILPEDWLGPLPIAAYFPRRRPLAVDLGSGKGRFLLARAAACPDVNFLGIERMLRRVRKVDRRVERQGLDNVRLLRMEAYYATAHLLPTGSVSTCYIFFPDPWPKKRHHAHRLFAPAFMQALHRVMVPGGEVHVATDHLPYFEEIRALLAADNRFRPIAPWVPGEAEQTDFERYYVGRGEIGRVSVETV
jgi:tRNA (guanine-N7-)-methyltransferase